MYYDTIKELADLERATMNGPDISEETYLQMEAYRSRLQKADSKDLLNIGNDIIRDDEPGRPFTVAHKLLEEYVKVRQLAEGNDFEIINEGMGPEEQIDRDEFRKSAEDYYYAAQNFLTYGEDEEELAAIVG